MSRRLLYHVSASVNRGSILAHGLDPRLMGGERGIAGSERRELDGVFVCHDREEADYFVEMGLRHLEAVDVWEIDDPGSVLQSNSGNYEYLPVAVPPERVRLVETVTASRSEPARDGAAEEQESPIDRELWAAIHAGEEAFEALIERGVIRRVEPVERSPQPLPPELAADLALVLSDVDRAGVTRGCSFALRPEEEPWADEEDEDGDSYDWVEVGIDDADGAPIARFLAMTGPDAMARRVELATAVQRCYVELDAVDGTLHPPCAPDHLHAAVAELRDGEAWWRCPADGRALAPVGSYGR